MSDDITCKGYRIETERYSHCGTPQLRSPIGLKSGLISEDHMYWKQSFDTDFDGLISEGGLDSEMALRWDSTVSITDVHRYHRQ